MKALPVWSAISVLAVSLAPLAQAQQTGGYVAPSVIYSDDDKDRVSDDGLTGFQVTFGRMLTDYLDLEGLIGFSELDGYSDNNISIADTSILDLSANVLFYPDRDMRVAPYILLGIGYLEADLDPGSSTSEFSHTYGIGFKYRLGDSNYSLRGEYRLRSAKGTRATDGTEGTLTDDLVTLGIQYNFSEKDRVPSAARQGGWYVAPALTLSDDDEDRLADHPLSAQVSFGTTITDHLDLEGLLGYTDFDGYDDANLEFPDQTVLELGVNAVLYPNRDLRFAPYFLAGVSYLSSDYEPGSSDTNIATTLGAGVKYQIGDSPYAIRADYRVRTADGIRARDGSEGSLTDNILSLGVQYSFGEPKRQAPENTDSDGDGVLDIWDECPNTPPGVDVSSRGCELRDLRTDSDGDGVLDGADQCPNTRAGEAVDTRGCSLDSDGDGVPSGTDRCPASRPGATVDRFGCERDDDEDGVVDHQDACPNTRAGARVDSTGCEIQEVIRLPGVNFENASDRLLPGADSLLQDAANTLIKYPDLVVEVAGHTDSTGLAETNFGLSERRAITVRDALIRLGASENQVTAVGYGETQPIAPNNTAEGRATNRRVELRIISR